MKKLSKFDRLSNMLKATVVEEYDFIIKERDHGILVGMESPFYKTYISNDETLHGFIDEDFYSGSINLRFRKEGVRFFQMTIRDPFAKRWGDFRDLMNLDYAATGVDTSVFDVNRLTYESGESRRPEDEEGVSLDRVEEVLSAGLDSLLAE
jgi:hypothetical protein